MGGAGLRTSGYRLWSEAYLGGLGGSAHGLGAGRAVVGGLLAVVLGPGGAVVRLASGLGGGGRRGLGRGLTFGGKENGKDYDTFVTGQRRPGSAQTLHFPFFRYTTITQIFFFIH